MFFVLLFTSFIETVNITVVYKKDVRHASQIDVEKLAKKLKVNFQHRGDSVSKMFS